MHKSFYDIYRNTLLEEEESSEGNSAAQDQASGGNKPVREKSWKVLCKGLFSLKTSTCPKGLGEGGEKVSSCTWCRGYGWPKTARWGWPS